MATCEITELGTYNSCDYIVIDIVTSEISVINTVTRRECTYADGDIGYLSPGDYTFTFKGFKYYFGVERVPSIIGFGGTSIKSFGGYDYILF